MHTKVCNESFQPHMKGKAKLSVINYKPLTAEIKRDHRKIRSQKNDSAFLLYPANTIKGY